MESSYLAHGKVILIGEHSVVYGYDALCLPITSLHIKTTIENGGHQETWMDTNRYHGPFFTAPAEYDGLKYVVKTMLAKAGSKKPLTITYTGAIPMERGFGSSATVALGTSKAMNQFFKLRLSEEKIMAITNHAEMINHGKASGLDAATVHSDHLIFFNTKMGPRKLAARLGANLLIMDTGQLGNTKKAVTMVHQQWSQSKTVKNEMARLGQLADAAKDNWLKQDAATIGKIFNQAQQILASFHLSTVRIDQLQKIALTNGALGFKLSGGGLGGIVIALCRNSETAKAIAKKSQKLITGHWIEEI